MSELISIIVPCYNQGKYLKDAIGSIITQTYSKWECIIVNDGSTDDTEEISKELLKLDERIKYLYESNKGLSNARNYGIQHAKGTFILPLDADDKIGATYLEKGISLLNDDNVKVVYCEAEYFGAKTGKWQIEDYHEALLAIYNQIFCSGIYRKVDFESVGGYNPNMKFGWEDWDFWIRLLKNGGKVVRIPETLFYYRIKDESMLKAMCEKKEQIMLMQLYLNNTDFFDQYYKMPLEFFPLYRSLKNSNKALQQDNVFLKGLIKLKRSSYILLIKKFLTR